MSCRMASIDSRGAAGYVIACACGWSSAPAARADAQAELHEHLNPPIPLADLVDDVVAAWALIDRKWQQWFDQGFREVVESRQENLQGCSSTDPRGRSRRIAA